MKACSIQVVSNMMQTADSVARFFNNSPKRQLALEKWIDSVLPEERRRKLKEMCRTRWIERHEAFEVFIDLFLPTVSCLEDIVHAPPSKWNRETRSDAQSHLLALSQFSFILTLVMTQKLLGYTKGLSVKLQGRYSDVVRAHSDIEVVKSTLKGVRSGVNSFHERLYEECIQICSTVDVQECVPRLASTQRHRSNTPADSVKDYYKRILTIPFLDYLISELDTRFNRESSAIVVECMHILPSELKSTLVVTDIANICKLYEDDLPSPRSLDSELELWRNKWTRESELAKSLNTPEKVLQYTDCDFFPNIRTLLLIMATLPVTSCECERSFSMLKLLKTPLRSSMSQERLNGLAMLKYHRDIDINPEDVVTEFARCHPRRLELL